MAAPRIKDTRHEAGLAAISLAGVRLLVQATIAPGASANASYTVAEGATRRVVLFHDSGGNLDLRVELNAAADATDMPLASGVYFVLEAVKDETIQVFNTTGGALTVNIAEIG